MSLNVQQLTEKIAIVDKDIKQLQADGCADRKLFTLQDYKSYLEDELKALQEKTEK